MSHSIQRNGKCLQVSLTPYVSDTDWNAMTPAFMAVEYLSDHS
jgi:hypothetical protein